MVPSSSTVWSPGSRTGESRLAGCTSSTSPGSTVYGAATRLSSSRGNGHDSEDAWRNALAAGVRRCPSGKSENRFADEDEQPDSSRARQANRPARAWCARRGMRDPPGGLPPTPTLPHKGGGREYEGG